MNFRSAFSLLVVSFLLAACSHTQEKNKSDGLTKIGISYLHSGNCTEALRFFLEAEKVYAEDPELYNSLGLAYFCKGENALAVTAYKRAVDLRPDFSEAWNNLGAALASSGRFDEAIVAFDEALKNLLYQTPERAWLNKGDAYAARFDAKNAITSYQKAIATAMPKAHARDVVCVAQSREGQVLIREKRFVDAVRSLQASIKLCPKYHEPHYHLSTAYAKLGKKDDAVKACKQVQSLAPESNDAQACANFIDLLKPKAR